MTENDYKQWFHQNIGWILIFISCGIPVVYWIAVNPISESFSTWSSAFASLGKIFGLVGFVLYAINILLAVRKQWLEDFFGGLNRVYIAHHLTGGIALSFILFHPLFLAIRYIELSTLVTFQQAAQQLLPRWIDFGGTFGDVQEAVALNAGIIAFLGMVILLIITFFINLPYRIWLYTHRFLGVAFVFAGLHTIFISSDVSRSPFLRFYILLWTIAGLVAFTYRTLYGNVFIRRAPYRVDRVDVFGGNTVGVEMTPMENKIDYKPGQFVFIRFPWSHKEGISSELHPFSIASAPQEKTMRLYMKALGDYTTSLKNLQPGAVAEIEGAFGRLTYTNFGPKPQVWIAGGIGITPFLSMARSINEKAPEINLFYSVKQRSELLDQLALKDYLPVQYKNFHYNEFVSDEKNTFLNIEYIERTIGPLKGKEFFICGPPAMMKSMKQQLKEKGISKYNIHSEEFTMS